MRSGRRATLPASARSITATIAATSCGLDIPHGFEEATNASMWKRTEEKVAELMTLPAVRSSLPPRCVRTQLGCVEGLAFDA